MPATIHTAQLDADALNKALRAVQHRNLEFGGGALVAPSGIKHLSEIRATLDDIGRAVHSSAPKTSTPESAAVAYDRQRAEPASVVDACSTCRSQILER